MRLYRSIDMFELIGVFKTGKIEPKNWEENKDSTAPSGCWSFWFKEPVCLEDAAALVVADVSDEYCREYIMTWRQEETRRNWEMEYDYQVWIEKSAPEIVVDITVSVQKVYISQFVIMNSSYGDMTKEESAIMRTPKSPDDLYKYKGFKRDKNFTQSFIDWAIPKSQSLFLGLEKLGLVGIRDYGRRVKNKED